MRFKHISIDGILSKTDFPIKDGFYRFDDDKIAYIQYVYDDGLKYNDTGKSMYVDSDSAFKSKEEVIAKLLLKPEFADFQIFDLIILSPIGRNLYFPIKKINKAVTIAIPVFELDVLWNIGDMNAIDLWKFSNALHDQLPGKPMMNFSFLDQYKIYIEHDNSFYLSDDTKDPFLTVEPGYGAELIENSKIKSDKHSVLKVIDGQLANIQVHRKDKYAPIYVDLMGLANSELEFAVEGYYQAVWVTPKPILTDIVKELRSMYWQFNDAIAYWLWQIQEDIKNDLSVLGETPLTVYFDFNPTEKIEKIERNFIRSENAFSQFHITSSENTFTIVIPSEIIPYLYGADNEGERILVRGLLEGINKLLSANVKPTISQEKIASIIKHRAPLGMKKKVFILDTNDNLLLDPKNLKSYRYVQEYDVNLVLNSIVPKLGSLCPSVGELTTKKKKNDLAFKVVQNALLPILREKINQYNSVRLLERLIGLNESLIRKREELRVHTPTRIACFVTVEQHQIDLQENLSNINRTTLAVRCLIEHLAAEPSAGNKMISTTGIDELIAIMDQTISWGSLSDQIHFDLFDISMGVLPSGRIGTDKTLTKAVFDPYYKSKTKEQIQNAIDTFKQVFPQTSNEEGKDVPGNLDKAFKHDYGISFSRICEFIEGLCHIGFQLETPFASIPLISLRAEINKYVDVFEEEEFQNGLAYLSLSNRGKIEKIPKGYQFIDIMPWRFNRMLSLLRKPLVIVDGNSENERTVYWGVRQALSGRMYLAEQCQSDRLRVFEDSEVKKVLGDFAQKRGDALVKIVIESINPDGLIVDQDVYIGPNHSLKNDTDIGDIDVLIIDPANKILFSIECKSMSPSRNIKEMISELDKLFGSDSEMGWLPKHARRHEWIEANRSQITAKYSTDILSYQIKSFFLTQEDMLTPYLKNSSLPIPFLTSYDIETGGMKALMK